MTLCYITSGVPEFANGISQHIARIESLVNLNGLSVGLMDLDERVKHIELVTFLGTLRRPKMGSIVAGAVSEPSFDT